jgi:hypothetical protein
MNEEKEVIKKFVSEKCMGEGRESCLMMALENARILCGRDKITGKKIDTDIVRSCEFKQNTICTQTSFSGLIHYLLLLDLIGSVFIHKENNIARAIKHFYPEMDDREVYTIVALRNSLAHNYGLVNIPTKEEYDENSLHKFTLDNFGELDTMIKLPEIIWDKKFPNKDEKMSTNIDVPKLIDFIEDIYKSFKEEVIDGKLKLKLIEIEELKARFTITH